MALLLSACGPAETGQPSPPLAEINPRTVLTPDPGVAGDPNQGRLLFVASGCGGCHTRYGVERAHGVAGPNITNITLRPTLAGDTIPMTPDALTRFLLDPQAVKPTSTMPRVGLTEQQARDLTAFLYSQPYNPSP